MPYYNNKSGNVSSVLSSNNVDDEDRMTRRQDKEIKLKSKNEGETFYFITNTPSLRSCEDNNMSSTCH